MKIKRYTTRHSKLKREYLLSGKQCSANIDDKIGRKDPPFPGIEKKSAKRCVNKLLKNKIKNERKRQRNIRSKR